MRMVEVGKDEFFATVGKLNVHPRSEREASFWETPGRVLLGKTTPGYMCKGPTAYFVVKHDAATFSGAFDPAAVTIVRHRPSVTQGEVSVYYQGQQLDRYGDTITLLTKGATAEAGAQVIGGWAGRGDAYWVDAARRNIRRDH